MTLIEKIEDLKNHLGNVLHNHRSAFVNVRALQAIRAERLAHIRWNLQNHPAPEVLHIPNSTSHPFQFARTEEAQIFAAIQATLAVWETSAEFLEAESLIQPLLDELARLEAELAAANLAAGEAEARRREQLETAKSEAIAEIESRFAPPAADPEPATEPPAPFRGKVKLASA